MDVGILQLGVLRQRQVFPRIADIVDEGVKQRHDADHRQTDHELLHFQHTIGFGRRQTDDGQHDRQTPDVFPPQWGWHAELFDFENEYVESIENVGRQFGEHGEEEQVVQEHAAFKARLVDEAGEKIYNIEGFRLSGFCFKFKAYEFMQTISGYLF